MSKDTMQKGIDFAKQHQGKIIGGGLGAAAGLGLHQLASRAANKEPSTATKIGETAGELVKNVNSGLDSAGDAISSGVHIAGNTLSNVGHKIVSILPTGADVDNAIKSTGEALDSAGDTISSGAHTVGNAISSGAHTVGDALSKASEYIPNGADVENAFSSATKAIGSGWDAAGDKISDFAKMIGLGESEVILTENKMVNLKINHLIEEGIMDDRRENIASTLTKITPAEHAEIKKKRSLEP
jgi:hypothetical protein